MPIKERSLNRKMFGSMKRLWITITDDRVIVFSILIFSLSFAIAIQRTPAQLRGKVLGKLDEIEYDIQAGDDLLLDMIRTSDESRGKETFYLYKYLGIDYKELNDMYKDEFYEGYDNNKRKLRLIEVLESLN